MPGRSSIAATNSTRGPVVGDSSSPEALTDSQSREESRAFLQRRVASFGLMLALVFGIFFLWRLSSALLGDDSPSQAFLPWQALSIAVFGGLWAICRGRPRSFRVIHVLEFSGLCLAGGAATMMCLQVSYAARPDAILLLCMTYTLIARAIMIPSSATRTFVYGLVFAAPFLLSVFFIHRINHNPSMYSAAADPRLRLDATTIAMRWTVVGGLWWVAALIIETATSKVIYGLRQEVRDARRLGQYTLTEKLGQGGMGVVYRARHALLRRPSAIKLLPPDRFGPASVERFEREVQLTAGLTHPNTIRVFDYGRTSDGVFYYVMEYLEGASLDEVVATAGAMPASRVIHILDQVTGALTEAHSVGLIHRDIKPANIFLTSQGGVPDVAKVLDFGLVKQVRPIEVDATELKPLTQDNSVTGTPQYMAPEAITTPESVDARTDVYAVGAVAYFLLTGQHVFSGSSLVEICSHHLLSPPPLPSQTLGSHVPRDLESLVLRCLEKEPHQRPSSARVLRDQLRECKDAGSWTEADARRWLEAHGPALRAQKAPGKLDGSETLAVDFGLRSNPPTRTRGATLT